MATTSSLKNRIERRLREVQREAMLVREDVRALRAALEKRDELERLPKLKSSRYSSSRISPPMRSDPVKDKTATAAKTPPPAAATTPSRSAAPEPAAPQSAARGATAMPRTVVHDDRFANLFSSSGFLGTAASAPMDHRVQRNKAIFVLIFVLVALFLVINLLTY